MQTFSLYENSIPLSVSDFVPTLTYCEPKEKKGKSAIVIFPGGAYRVRSVHEGEGYAKFFQENGISAFVCDYRVKPESFPRPLLDARHAVRYVRAHAEEFGIDPEKILVMGSSAGGHLASLVSTYHKALEGEECDPLAYVDPTPNGTILCYPVIDMIGDLAHLESTQNLLGEHLELALSVSSADIVDDMTPPAFIWHTSSDPGVHVENSYKYAMALRRRNIPTEIHVFPRGGHGLGLSPNDSHIAQWSNLLLNWLRYMDF